MLGNIKVGKHKALISPDKKCSHFVANLATRNALKLTCGNVEIHKFSGEGPLDPHFERRGGDWGESIHFTLTKKKVKS